MHILTDLLPAWEKWGRKGRGTGRDGEVNCHAPPIG